MSPIAKNILSVILGFVAGCAVNISLVSLGPSIIRLPEGADVSSSEGLERSMLLFTARHFLFPFLGHALGTLVGAFVTAKVAASRHMGLAMGIGGLFLCCGIMMVCTVGGPVWFIIIDLVFAYLPMAFLGGKLGLSAGSLPTTSSE